MNEDDLKYDGRTPAFGRITKGENAGKQYVRGYRTKPGSPMHDPTSNVPTSQDRRTPQSNWDSIFRNTVTNNFGQTGPNSAYKNFGGAPAQGAAGPTGAAGSSENYQLPPPDETMKDWDLGAPEYTPPSASANTGISPFSGPTNHAQEWSVPPRRGPDRNPGYAPFMPHGPNDPFFVPKPTGNYGADMAANKSMYAPGGATGFFRPRPDSGGFQTTNRAELNDIQNRYASNKKNPFGWGSAFDT